MSYGTIPTEIDPNRYISVILLGGTDAVPLVRAEGKLIHAGRQVATSEARLVGPDGKLYAHATTTCLVFDQPSALHRAASSLTGLPSTVSESVHVSA